MLIYREELKMSTKAPETLTDTECLQLLAAVLEYPDTERYRKLAQRDLLILLLMLDAGLRDGEVVQLLVRDLVIIEEPVSSLRVRAEISKSKLDRIIPLTQRTIESIRRCHQLIWSAPDKAALIQANLPAGVTVIKPKVHVRHADDFAFPSRSSAGHLTIIQVWRIVKSLAAKSIHRDIHPHILRHTFATRLMRTTNARIVQELLGHKFISSTQIYMHPGSEDLRKAVDSIEVTT